MIHDMWTVLRKEVQEIARMQDSRRFSLLGLFASPVLVGIVLPLQMGRAWVESPVAVFVWIWLPPFLTLSLVADAFAGERERHTLETLLATRLPDRAILFGKVAAAIAYGWGTTLLGLLVGLVTVNLAHGRGQLLIYAPVVLLASVVLTLLAAGLAASGGVLLSLRAATVRQVQQMMGLAIMVLALVPSLLVQALPRQWRLEVVPVMSSIDPVQVLLVVGAAVLLLDGVLLLAAVARFQRSRLTFG